MNTDIVYCRSLVESHDRDRYILTLAAAKREDLWALYAFNYEIAKTREIVRDASAGMVRLAWWREALAEFYAGQPMPAHDVARALGHAITAHKLPHTMLDDLIDARMMDMEDETIPGSLQGLSAYADMTNTPLLKLSAAVLNTQEVHLNHLGIAYGITGIIRALPYLAQQNRCLMPLPMLHEIGLMPEQFHHLKPSAALSKAIEVLADLAHTHLAQVVPVHPLFKMQKKMTALYLGRMKKAAYNPFDPRVCSTVPFLGLRLLLA